MATAAYSPSALTSAAIQTAIDSAHADGGGAVFLGSDTYVCTSEIVLPQTVSLLGNRAVLNSSTGSQDKLLKVASDLSGPTRGHSASRVEGILFRGSGTGTQAAVHIETATNSSDRSSKLHIRNCDIQDFKFGIVVRQNAFCCKFYSVDIRNCATCVRTYSGDTNRGEALSFFGCTIGGSSNCVYQEGHSVDMYFFGCSFDFPSGAYIYANDHVECHGCHFESGLPGANQWRMQVDTNGFVMLHGGSFSCGNGSAARTIFQVWGQGGAFYLNNVKGYIPDGATLCNDMDHFHTNAESGSFLGAAPVEEDAPVAVGAVSTWSSDTNATSYTSSGLGAIATGERAVVAIYARSSVTTAALSSVTIGGVAMSELATNNNAGSRVSLYIGPEGQSGQVAATFDASMARCGIALWPVSGVISATAFDTAGANGDPSSLPIDVEAGGAVFAVVGESNAATYTWAGATEAFDIQFESNTMSGAAEAFATAQTALALSADAVGSGSNQSACAAAIR
jgi:hypothetical protein